LTCDFWGEFEEKNCKGNKKKQISHSICLEQVPGDEDKDGRQQRTQKDKSRSPPGMTERKARATATAKATADPYGMTTKGKSRDKGKSRVCCEKL